MSRRSQFSVEFIILLGVAMVILVILLIAYGNRQNEIRYAEEVAQAENVAQELGVNINEMHFASNGTTTNIFVSPLIGTYNYSLNLRENILEITWAQGYYSYPLVTANVSLGTLGSNITLLKNGTEVMVS